MNPDLQKQLSLMLAKLTDATQTAAAWTTGQIPPLVQEKIVFGRVWETSLWLLLVLMAFLGTFVCWKAMIAQRILLKKNQFDDDILLIFGAIGSGLVAAGCVVGAIGQLESVFMVWFAPRLYIVEWLREMLKA